MSFPRPINQFYLRSLKQTRQHLAPPCKNRLCKFGQLIAFITITAADILDTNHSDSPALVALIIPSMPKFILYVLVTGDIHG